MIQRAHTARGETVTTEEAETWTSVIEHPMYDSFFVLVLLRGMSVWCVFGS